MILKAAVESTGENSDLSLRSPRLIRSNPTLAGFQLIIDYLVEIASVRLQSGQTCLAARNNIFAQIAWKRSDRQSIGPRALKSLTR